MYCMQEQTTKLCNCGSSYCLLCRVRWTFGKRGKVKEEILNLIEKYKNDLDRNDLHAISKKADDIIVHRFILNKEKV